MGVQTRKRYINRPFCYRCLHTSYFPPLLISSILFKTSLILSSSLTLVRAHTFCFTCLHSRSFAVIATSTSNHSKQSELPLTITTMCIQLVERYSVCKCLYYRHAVDPCSGYKQRHHTVQERTMLVGYACPSHSLRYSQGPSSSSQQANHSDSGYSSGGAAFQYSSGYHR